MSSKNLECAYCGCIAHPGRCRAWYAANPELAQQHAEKLRRNRGRGGTTKGKRSYTPQRLHRTPEWLDAARHAKEGLIREFMGSGDTGPWTMKLHELLRMKDQ